MIISNYHCLRAADVILNPDLNIIVGDNESENSTLLEVIHLALTGQLNGRPLQTELHPHRFHAETVAQYIAALIAKTPAPPPSILIEFYFHDDAALSKLKGTNNLLNADLPGVALSIDFNQDYAEEFKSYVADPTLIRTLPINYYVVKWRGFADNELLASRSIPIKPAFIDASTIRNNAAASRYVVDITRPDEVGADGVKLLSARFHDPSLLRQDKSGINPLKSDVFQLKAATTTWRTLGGHIKFIILRG